MRRVLFAALMAAGSIIAGSPAVAATEAPFEQAAFAAAQKQDQPILVEVTAPWCPVCAKQRPILARITGQPSFAPLKVYTVDFDSQKDVLRTLGVQMQSTLIVFRGGKELGRSTGVTDEAAISSLLDQVKG